MKPIVFVAVLVIILVLIGALAKTIPVKYGGLAPNADERYTPYSHLRAPFNAPDGMGACEFSEACLGNVARWAQMSNGMEGNCTLGGILCPAFSKDHYDEMKRLGII